MLDLVGVAKRDLRQARVEHTGYCLGV